MYQGRHGSWYKRHGDGKRKLVSHTVFMIRKQNGRQATQHEVCPHCSTSSQAPLPKDLTTFLNNTGDAVFRRAYGTIHIQTTTHLKLVYYEDDSTNLCTAESHVL